MVTRQLAIQEGITQETLDLFKSNTKCMMIIIFLLSTDWSGQLSLFTQFAVELFRTKRGYTRVFFVVVVVNRKLA